MLREVWSIHCHLSLSTESPLCADLFRSRKPRCVSSESPAETNSGTGGDEPVKRRYPHRDRPTRIPPCRKLSLFTFVRITVVRSSHYPAMRRVAGRSSWVETGLPKWFATPANASSRATAKLKRVATETHLHQMRLLRSEVHALPSGTTALPRNSQAG